MALSVIESNKNTSLTPSIDWAAVQLNQFEHDEKYHREICRLSTQDRLRHMALHFAKYAGKLHDGPDEGAFRQITVDTMVIAVSCANIMNVDLPLALGTSFPLVSSRMDFARQLSISAGRMAAACEKLDHLEDFPFRSTLKTEALSILLGCVAMFELEGREPVREMMERLAQIKGKSIFHGRI